MAVPNGNESPLEKLRSERKEKERLIRVIVVVGITSTCIVFFGLVVVGCVMAIDYVLTHGHLKFD